MNRKVGPLGSGSRRGKHTGTGPNLGYSGDGQYFNADERSRWLMGMTTAMKKTEPELSWLPWRNLQEGLLNEASKVKKSMHSMVLVL